MKKPRFARSALLALLILPLILALLFASSFLTSRDVGTVDAAPQPAASQSAQDEAIASPLAQQALARLQSQAALPIEAHVARQTAVYDLVRATGTSVLSVDSSLVPAESRARTFLGANGDLVGMTAPERALAATAGVNSVLQLVRVNSDDIGGTHVRFDQLHNGLKVFGGQLIVHMNSQGIKGISGNYVPNVRAGTTPTISAAAAAAIALKQQVGSGQLQVVKSELGIYQKGLLEGYLGQSVLAYSVEVTDGAATRQQIWIDARKGSVLNRIALNANNLNRIIYTPAYGPPFDVRHEGDPLTPGPTPGTTGAEPINNLYVMAGNIYNLFRSGFGRDAYDGLGHTMHSVLLVNQNCPNAYWNSISTNYCPDFDADDVVCHEWTHAYTEYTHGLIYAYQSGALNEAYSDIFGETADLINGVDAEGGSNNAQPMPNGQRWQIGEDVNGLNQPAVGILRDMWDPTRYGDPDKVSSPNYACGSGDGGGVHTNSGVVNHAYAMLVDGATFNGQNITGIGFNRAAAIYYRAMTVYQTPSTDFPFHAQALHASCNDLIGQNTNALSTSSTTSTPSGDIITATTCQQVDKAMLAVEMSQAPPCPVITLLDPNAPAACDGATTIFSEDFEAPSGDAGWTRTSQGTFPEWENDRTPPTTGPHTIRDFKLTSTPPGAHTGTVAYAKAPKVGEPGGGDCTPVVGQDYSGQFTLDSTTITIPAGANDVKLSFEHYVATESGFDGGQVELSVNGLPFQLVPQSEYVFNGPFTSYGLPPPVENNTNPNPGEDAWTGTNVGQPVGSPPGNWGTTIINLANLTNPGDTVKIRFTWSQDGCNGVDGWYIDNIRLYNCALLEAPVLSLGPDYQNPDPNGAYTLNWTRPAGATGPDVLQESSVCGPLLVSDASSLAGWTAANDGPFSPNWTTSSAKPGHTGDSAFWAAPATEQGFDSATLTYNTPIQIPATGITTLKFSQWYFNEDDDRGFVEVSTNNGATWTAIYTNARGMGDLPDAGADAFANEPLTPQELDLTIYSGQSIRLRFRYFQGPSDFVFFVQYGWYIDDISITNDSWVSLTNADVTSLLVTGRSNGTRCYRARTTYPVGIPSPFSNQVSATTNIVCSVANVALSSAGAVAVASSTHSSNNFPALSALDGDRTGATWGSGTGGWNDNTRNAYPDIFEVDFAVPELINLINVFTLQNNWTTAGEPTLTTPATGEGILDFIVQYCSANCSTATPTWSTVTGGNVTGNDKAWRQFSFTPVTTSKIRVVVNNSRNNWSRIVELEAYRTCP